MNVYRVRNPNEALREVTKEERRFPVSFTYSHPMERIVTHVGRPFNVAYALRETLTTIVSVCNESQGFAFDNEGATMHIALGGARVVFFRSGKELHSHAMVDTLSMDTSGPFEATALNLSVLHEYVAAKFNLRIGTHTITTCDLRPPEEEIKEGSSVFPVTRVVGADLDRFERDVAMLHTEGAKPIGFRDKFVRQVAVPVFLVETALMDNRPSDALTYARQCLAPDWEKALCNWISEKVK